VDRAAAGEEIIVVKAGKPKADIADDFDRPLAPELQNYFE
jgi:antitoxin (DNA-binding transcriptional repressor) of toxin-antitoxin stability system